MLFLGSVCFTFLISSGCAVNSSPVSQNEKDSLLLKPLSSDQAWIHGEVVGKIFKPPEYSFENPEYFLKITSNNKKIYRLHLINPAAPNSEMTPQYVFGNLPISSKIKFLGYKQMRDCDPAVLKEKLPKESLYLPPYDYSVRVNIERFPDGEGEIPCDQLFSEGKKE